MLYNFNQQFFDKSSTGEQISKEHQQKGAPYRKTSSQGKFPTSIVKASTSTNTNIVFPCKLCSGNINDRDAALEFDMCQFWVHLRCNKLNLVDYKYLQGSTDPWLCLSCCSLILPFGNLTDKDFSYSILNNYIEISNKNSFVLLKSPPNLALLFNQFNNSSPEQ